MRPDQMSAAERTGEAPQSAAMAGGLVGPVELTLSPSLDAPAAARAAVTAWMAGHVSETMLADAELIVGELVANSVRHADAPAGAVIGVRAEVRTDVLRLEVEDQGRRGSVARRKPDLRRGGGFGLNVVEALSRRWAVERDSGTRVWAELAFAAPGSNGR
jgi:serine/threonine-protein kinase RsbW